MTTRMTATVLKATLLRVLDDVAAGEEVEVTKHGRPVARIVPIHSPAALRGQFTGVALSSDDDEDLFGTDESWEAR